MGSSKSRYVAAGSNAVGAGAAAWALFTVVSAAAAPNRPAIFLSMFPLWNFHNQRLRGRGDNSHASTWFLDSARPGDAPATGVAQAGAIAMVLLKTIGSDHAGATVRSAATRG